MTDRAQAIADSSSPAASSAAAPASSQTASSAGCSAAAPAASSAASPAVSAAASSAAVDVVRHQMQDDAHATNNTNKVRRPHAANPFVAIVRRVAPHDKAEAFLLWIAAFKLIKGTLLVLLAFGVFRLLLPDRQANIEWFIQHLRVDPNNKHLHSLLERLLGVSRGQLEAIGVGTLFYASMFYIEGVGLLLRKRWAEWMTVITGSGFIPLEIWELIRRPHLMRGVVLLVNVLIVAYLVWMLKRKKTGEAASDAARSGAARSISAESASEPPAPDAARDTDTP